MVDRVREIAVLDRMGATRVTAHAAWPAGRARIGTPGTGGLRWAPGLLITVAIAVAATWLGRLVPIVGGPVFGILAGALVAETGRRVARRLRVDVGTRVGAALAPGITVAAKSVLQISIVVLGTGLSLARVLSVGGQSLPIMLGTLAVALLGAVVLGRALKVGSDTRMLVGVGTGICGASAIAAVTAVVDAAEADVAYAIGTIFTFNIAAVLLFPLLGHALGLSQHAFGLWSGTAINDTSSVVAASYSYGSAAGAYGVVVKLTRSLMIVPICLILQLRSRRAGRPVAGGGTAAGADARPWWRALPIFIVGFLAASAADTVGLIPTGWHPALSQLGTFLITVALVGIGASMRPADMRKAGPRPLLLGGCLWVLVGASSLGLQALLGQL